MVWKTDLSKSYLQPQGIPGNSLGFVLSLGHRALSMTIVTEFMSPGPECSIGNLEHLKSELLVFTV